MKRSLVLGVDGGGTTTTASVADSDGTVVGTAVAGPSNIKAVGADEARNNLRAAVTKALDAAGVGSNGVDAACYGLAGFDRPEDKRILEAWVADWGRRSVFVNDGDLVIAAGTAEGWGVGVISGTGSIAVGRAPDGRRSRSGGWGHLIGDEGSAYAVALSGLRMVARRFDGRDASQAGDVLTRELCHALQVSDPSRLVSAIHAPGFDRRAIASLAPVVVAAAEQDPEIVDQILRPAAFALAETAAAAARALGWSEGPLPLAMAGGFLLRVDEVARSLLIRLGVLGYEVRAIRVSESVRGALILAREALPQ
jgi:N-acetylglucosamine kinase-like BadF-type ATPase